MKDENIPWVEKYRPTTFNDIVIDEEVILSSKKSSFSKQSLNNDLIRSQNLLCL